MAGKSKYMEQIEALTKISNAITSDLYLNDILSLIVTVTAKLMNSKICSLMLINEKNNTLVVRATQSVSEEYLKKPPLKVGEGIAGLVAKENRPISVYDIITNKHFKYKNIAKKEGLCSLLAVPLSVKGKVIGVLNCHTSFPHKFSKNEIEVLTAVANQSAVTIENTELMVKTKVIQQELEIRKLVERAKGTLMRERGLSEDEAYRSIQKLSMDHRKSMREIAEAVIMASKIGRKTKKKHLTSY